MPHLELKIEDGGLWIEDRPSKCEDFIMPQRHFIHLFLYIYRQNSLIFSKSKNEAVPNVINIYFFFEMGILSI